MTCGAKSANRCKHNKSDKEIVDFLVARYGDFVLYRPPVKSTTLFLWFGPFILLLVGAVLLVVLSQAPPQAD